MSRSLAEWLNLLEERHPSSIDLGLERVGEVWRRLGSPRPAEKIFTVAGTNGKGSVVAYLCHLLGALGQRYGCYTTPHLLHYRERIQVNGEPVSDEDIVDAFERIEEARQDVSLTYFEFGTLAALVLMERASLDYAVMEVGLGGRLDAVNILDADCAVITPVGLDHQEYLGDTREAIGAEKAGILRPGVPFVCGDPDPPQSVVERARSLETPIYRLGREFSARQSGRVVEFSWKGEFIELPLPSMRGRHQVDNMATSMAALLALMPQAAVGMGMAFGGLQEVQVSGRLQQLNPNPLVLIDVGHNPLAAEVVRDALIDASHIRPGGVCRCVIGMLADKDAAEVARILDPLVDRWYCAGLGGDRGRTGLDLSRKVLSVADSAKVLVCPDVPSALDGALDDSNPNDCVLVFGSFVTAAAAMEHWHARSQQPE